MYINVHWKHFQAYSFKNSFRIIVMNLIFMFSLWCIDWVGSLYANRIFMFFSVLRVTSGPRVKLAGRKSVLTTPHPPPPPPAPPGLFYWPF